MLACSDFFSKIESSTTMRVHSCWKKGQLFAIDYCTLMFVLFNKTAADTVSTIIKFLHFVFINVKITIMCCENKLHTTKQYFCFQMHIMSKILIFFCPMTGPLLFDCFIWKNGCKIRYIEIKRNREVTKLSAYSKRCCSKQIDTANNEVLFHVQYYIRIWNTFLCI